MPHSHSPTPQNLIESALVNSMSSKMEPGDYDASQNAGICALEELLHQGAKVDFSHPLFNEKSRGGLLDCLEHEAQSSLENDSAKQSQKLAMTVFEVLRCLSRAGQMLEDLSDYPGLLEPPVNGAQAIALGTRDRIDRETSASHGRKLYRRV